MVLCAACSEQPAGPGHSAAARGGEAVNRTVADQTASAAGALP